jgi:hypothetical protein
VWCEDLRVRTLDLSDGDGGALTIVSDDQPEPLCWRVALQTNGLSASTDVDLDGLRRKVVPIGEFFAALAADWRGWAGERVWGSAPLTLIATHDGLGHVTLFVELEERYDLWRARGQLVLEAGRLEQIARDAAHLPDLLPDA